ncbi:alkaline ceramidase TOD1 [Rutidosis leptorrhynchoides]|uniref:alkaline ceramidase TOD1 n=1 Tax=Rutidosis leptorrhynchoides TaxID=125765 RepID=UPI003A995870
MGKLTKTSTPLLFQSKLLCFSLSYLFLSLLFAFYNSISSTTRCHFGSSLIHPIQSPLFNYPPSYGQHKHPIPTLHSSCDSPVFFKDYWFVLNEIRRIAKNSSWNSKGLRYVQRDGNEGGFGMNYTTKKRMSYFEYRNDGIEIPCGFFKKFPISVYDKIAMESCNEVVVVSAIFGDHDKIRQPKGLGYKTLDHVCFYMFVDEITLKQFYHHNLLSQKNKENRIGVWRIVKVSSDELYENSAMNGVIPKFLVHRLFPNSKYSIWVDAKMQLVVDPLLLLHSLVIEPDVDMAISKHPFYVHTMEEAIATARWKKWWNINALRIQMETYCENGLQPWSTKKHPYPSDVPDSAIILRKHGVASNLFSCLLFNELEAFNPRDQLPFAFVRDQMNPKMKLNMFDVEVFEHVAIEYRHNIKHGGSVGVQIPRTKWASPDSLANGGSGGKCDSYLKEMWGESKD